MTHLARILVPLLLLATTVAAWAQGSGFRRVVVRGVRICCERCEADLLEVLDQVPGIQAVEIDRQARRVEFRAVEHEDCQQALEALSAAGFHGEVRLDDRPLAMPVEPLNVNLRADQVRFTGVHLCCEQCAEAVARAYRHAREVQSVDCDLKAGSVTLTGKSIPVFSARRALFSAGLSGQYRR